MCARKCKWVHVCVCVNVYVYMHAYMQVCVCAHECMCVCVCVHVSGSVLLYTCSLLSYAMYIAYPAVPFIKLAFSSNCRETTRAMLLPQTRIRRSLLASTLN